jgi:N-methylhydantoinase B
VLNPGTAQEREILPTSDGVQLKRGDLLRLMTCGGGGWGDPCSRDPMLVRQDVARGFVSVQGALEDYGVALDPGALEIDKAATEAVRKDRRGMLPLFDRGPSFAQAEAEWYAAKRARA